MHVTAIRERYCHALKHHKDLQVTVPGLEDSVPVEEVYLSRTLLQEVPQKESEREAGHGRPSDAHDTDRVVTVKQPIHLWVTVKTERVVLIEGPAGMGKSTLSKHLVQECLDQHQWLPIWIPFRNFVASNRSLLAYLEHDYVTWLGLADLRVPHATSRHESLGRWLHNWWDSRQAVLILDGLDEVVDPAERTKALEKLPSTGPHPRRPLTILTSRPLGHGLPLVMTKIELQELSPKEQVTLIENYGTHLKRTRQQIDIDAFIQQVGLGKTKASSSSQVRLLLQRPGHLVQLLEVYAETGQVLETETEVLTHLLEKRLEFTGRSHRMVTLADPDHTNKKRLVLETMAFHLLACRQGHSLTRPQLLALLEQVLQEHARAGTPLFPVTQATVLLNDFVQNSGLLTRVGLEAERYQVESVIWLHHLAGGALANKQIVTALNLTEMQVVELLDKKAWDLAEWEPVLKSWVGKSDNPFPLFERLIDKTQDDLARHRLGTAGRCLFEVKPRLRGHAEYQRLSVQIPTEAFEVWKGNAERETRVLVETSLQGAWAETERGQAEVLKLLTSSIEHTEKTIRVLGRLGAEMPEPVQQALAELSKDPESSVRWAACQALEGVGASLVEPVQQTLVAGLKDPNTFVCEAASRALREVGASLAEPVRQTLVAGLKDPEDSVREAACRALGGMGTSLTEPVQQALAELLKDPEDSVRQTACQALRGMGDSLPELAQQTLVGWLKDPNESVCRAASYVLEGVGASMAESVQQTLVGWLKDQPWSIREAVRLEFERVGASMPEPAQQFLVGWLKDPAWSVRKLIKQLFKKSDIVSAKSGIVKNIELDPMQHFVVAVTFKCPRVFVRKAVCRVLGGLGTSIPALAQQTLVEMLRDEVDDETDSDDHVGRAASKALAKVGASLTEPVQETLVEWLKDPAEFVREAASKALASGQQQGLRFFHAKQALHPGQLVSDLSAMPLFSDGCATHEPVRRASALVPLNV